MYCRFSFRRLKEAGGGRGTNCDEGVGRRKGRRREGTGGGGEKKGGNGRWGREGRVAGKSRGKRSGKAIRGKKRDGRGREGCVEGWGEGEEMSTIPTHLLQLMHSVLTYLQLIIRGHHLQFIELPYLLRVYVLLQLPCGIFVRERAPLDKIVRYNLTIGLCL